jgi:hypothetical protein
VNQLPEWVPKPVADRARELAQRGPPSPGLLRLATDERMKRVWRELCRRHRDGGDYLHPVRILPKELAQVEDRQGAGMAILFSNALAVAFDERWATTSTSKEAEAAREGYKEGAAWLRVPARALNERVTSLSSHPDNDTFRLWAIDAARKLEDAATVLDELAQTEAEAELPDRNRASPRERQVGVKLVEFCRTVFGTPLFGLVAIIVSVLFESKITPSTVREWAQPRD